MTEREDLPGELRAIAAVLKTGAAGQRDAWVPHLEMAADEIERLRQVLPAAGLEEFVHDADPTASV